MRGVPALLVMAAVPAAAQTLCVKPPVPLCMQESQTYVAAERLIQCQEAVRDYIDTTMKYLKCLNEETTATGQELKQNVDRFNCRLSGKGDCS